ncbi:MAG: hypothetical protein EU541_00775 [Promethearchaeota archaeon]|nr:MAG: hypothetical protein EU541_00775 [Candidatus Lokiarchaeota archaeon]
MQIKDIKKSNQRVFEELSEEKGEEKLRKWAEELSLGELADIITYNERKIAHIRNILYKITNENMKQEAKNNISTDGKRKKE